MFVKFHLATQVDTFSSSRSYITHSDWSNVNQNYFAYIQTLALTLFAILAGIYQLYFRRLKWLLVVGLFIRLIGVGVMIETKGAQYVCYSLFFRLFNENSFVTIADQL